MGRHKKNIDIDDSSKYLVTNSTYKPIADKLKERYPEFLPYVETDKILFLSNLYTDNRSKACNLVFASVMPISKKIKVAYKQLYGTSYEYIMEIMENHIENWTNDQKVLLIYHELMHIAGDGKTYKHDLQDFKEIIRIGGVNWNYDGNYVPHILHDAGQEDSPDEEPLIIDIHRKIEPVLEQE